MDIRKMVREIESSIAKNNCTFAEKIAMVTVAQELTAKFKLPTPDEFEQSLDALCLLKRRIIWKADHA